MGDSVALNYPGAFSDGGSDTTSVPNQYYAWFTGGAAPVDPTGVTSWLNANAKTVLIGAGVFLVVMMLTGGRR